MEYVNAERQRPALGYQMHVLPEYARVGARSPAIQLQVTRVYMDNVNVAIVLPALAVLLYVSMDHALRPEELVVDFERIFLFFLQFWVPRKVFLDCRVIDQVL